MKFFRNTLAALILVLSVFVLVLAPVAPAAAAGCGGGYRYPSHAYYSAWRTYPYVDYHSGYYRSYYPSVHVYGGLGYGYDGYRPGVPAYSYGRYGWGAATGYSSYCY